jgi:hypothetical protein
VTAVAQLAAAAAAAVAVVVEAVEIVWAALLAGFVASQEAKTCALVGSACAGKRQAPVGGRVWEEVVGSAL